MTLHGYVRLGSELLTDGSGNITAPAPRSMPRAASPCSSPGRWAQPPVAWSSRRNDVGFGVWGLMELQAKLDFRQTWASTSGVRQLQFNTTSGQHVESLAFEDRRGRLHADADLPDPGAVVPRGGGRQVCLPPPSFDGSDPLSGTELFRINGVASLGINEDGLQLFSEGDVQVGPRTSPARHARTGVFRHHRRGHRRRPAGGRPPSATSRDQEHFQSTRRPAGSTPGKDVKGRSSTASSNTCPTIQSQLVDIADPEKSRRGTFTGSASQATWSAPPRRRGPWTTAPRPRPAPIRVEATAT